MRTRWINKFIETIILDVGNDVVFTTGLSGPRTMNDLPLLMQRGRHK